MSDKTTTPRTLPASESDGTVCYRYWMRWKEQDGSWSDWAEIDKEEYEARNQTWDQQLTRTRS